MGSFPSLNPSLPTSIPGIYEPPSAVGPSLPISIANGGTGQTSAAAALTALGGAPTGSHILKRGTGLGNYTGNNTSFAAIDSTNLDITTTVPLGMLAIALLWLSDSPDANHTSQFGIAVDGTAVFGAFQGGSTIVYPASCVAILVGDGASHTFSPQAAVGSGGLWTVANSLALIAPFHLLLMIAAT